MIIRLKFLIQKESLVSNCIVFFIKIYSQHNMLLIHHKDTTVKKYTFIDVKRIQLRIINTILVQIKYDIFSLVRINL